VTPDTELLFRRAVTLHQQRQLAGTEAMYRQILACEPRTRSPVQR
jgi:hypothetical protein